MNLSSNCTTTRGGERTFRFLVRGGSVTRATLTLRAEDIEVAWARMHALFPGADLSETEVELPGRQ